MHYTWRRRQAAHPHVDGIDRWVWDSNTHLITAYRGECVARTPYTCRTALAWFRAHSHYWEPEIDIDLQMDEGL